MNVRDLRIFLSVAELGSLTMAAEALGCSQPSVSRCIQDLEETLGFKLLERTGRRISLAPEGVAFEEEARRLLASFEDIGARTLARAGQSIQPMTISATYALGTGLVPHALANWLADERPDEIRIIQGAPNAVAQDLLAGRARIGLSSLPLDVPGIRCLRAFKAPLVAALPLPQASNFPDDDPVRLDDLAKIAPLVTMLDQSRLQGRIAHQLSLSGAHPRQAFHVNSTVAALQMVRTTGASAIVEPVTAYGMNLPDVCLRRLADPIDYSLGFFATDGTAATRATARFFDLCEQALFSMIPHLARIPLSGETRTGVRP